MDSQHAPHQDAPEAPEDSANPELIVGEVVHDCTVSGEFGEITDIFADYGGIAGMNTPDGGTDPDHVMACKDATIAQLQAMLEALLPLTEDLREADEARKKAERLAASRERELRALRSQLAATSEELQVARIRSDERAVRRAVVENVQRLRQKVRRLERQRILREGVLSRERRRHAATREKLAERRRVATQRWREIRRLRAERKG